MDHLSAAQEGSNVKCMYCNKHVNLKQCTGCFIGLLELIHTLVPC